MRGSRPTSATPPSTPVTVAFTAAAVVAAFVAAMLSTRVDTARLRRWFAYLVFTVAGTILVQIAAALFT